MNLIKRILIIFSISFLIPILIMMIHLTAYEYNITYNSYLETMTQALENMRDEARTYVRDLELQIERNADSDSFRNLLEDTDNPRFMEDANNEIKKIINYSSNAENIIIISLDGSVITSYEAVSSRCIIDYDIMATARAAKQTIVDFRFFESGSNLYFTAYNPIIRDGEVLGYYVQFCNTDYLEVLLSAHRINTRMKFLIIDSDNTVVSENRFYNLNDTASSTDSEVFENRFKSSAAWVQNKIHSIKYLSEKRENMRAVFVREEQTNLCFMYTCPKSMFTVNGKYIMIIIVVYMILILGLLFLICGYMNRYLKKAFNEIFKTIEIYEMGDWTYRPNVNLSDEMGSIANSLWKLAQNLNRMYMDMSFNEYRYKLAMEFSSDIIYDYDLTKNVMDSDKRKWDTIFPFEFVRNEKKIFEEFIKYIHPEDLKNFEDYRKRLLKDSYDEIEKQTSIEFRMKLTDGVYHWIGRNDVLVKGVSDTIEHIIGTYMIIDEKKNSELALTKKATIDSLTGLYNRFTFINKTTERLESGELENAAFIFVDLDDFKFINDTYGHDAGDDVLRFVGSVIQNVTEGHGFGGRYGGDEFLLFLEDKNIATASAQNILDQLAKDFNVRGKQIVLKIHSSLGISYYSEHGTEVEGLIKKADNAMYYSKKHGKNRYTVFDKEKGDYGSET